MAVNNLYDSLYQRVRGTATMLPLERRAMFWFRRYIHQLTDWQNDMRGMTFEYVRDGHTAKAIVPVQAASPGCLYFFLYDAKHKATLPYYDQFPFTLVLDRDETSFMGLNFHYLSYFYRAMFFDALYDTRTKTGDDLQRRLQITYDLLKISTKYRAFRPCLKRYLITHVRTPLLQVGMSEWDVALFLPVESFSGATSSVVWRDSERRF